MRFVVSLVSFLSLVSIAGAQNTGKQTPPVKMGTSGGSANDISRLYCCGGTLGALVTRDGVVCILSNNHILARSGSASSGEDTIQPGLIDSNCSASGNNIVGDFASNYVPLGSANVDAALSTARAGMVDTSGTILGIGIPSATPTSPTVGLAVTKSGRTTGVTTGSITAINLSVSIQYQKGCNQGKKFVVSYSNQIGTTNMSAGGDSGSLLVTNNSSHHVVGLLYAGSSSTTIYNPWQSVVNAFTAGGHSFSLVGSPLVAESPLEKKVIGPSSEDLELALEAKVENEDRLMKTPGVLGVGIGAAEDNASEAALVVYFDRSFVSRIPDRIDGFKVRVIVTDPIVAQ